MTPIDRKTAKSHGLTHYFTGELCKNGHLSERYVSTGACVECLRPQKSKTNLSKNGLNLSEIGANLSENGEIAKMQAMILELQSRIDAALQAKAVASHADQMAELEARRVAAQEEADRRAAVHEAFGNMIQKRFRLYEEDVATFKAAALAFSVMRCPALRLEDMQPARTAQGVNRASGTAMFTFMIYADDYQALLDYSNQLLSARSCFNPERARQQAIASAEQAAALDDNGEPPMNFK